MNKKLSRIYLLATFTVALFYNQSIVAQSLSFDGVDDWVEVIDLSQHVVETNTTLMGWFKSTNDESIDSDHEGIFGFRNYPELDASYFALMN